MDFNFKKAERKKIKLRIGLIGPSGSGKTFSSLRLATGIGGRIAVIDTENRRSEIYANEFNFDILNLEPPFTPERYIQAIAAAEQAGYDTLIIDNISHEWIGKGGILDTKSAMTDKNDFLKWSKLTPRHDAFIDKIVRSNLHIICTLRGKDEYVLEENSQGKQTPKKVGVGSQQRDGFEYECTVSLLIDQEKHIATAAKDNTHYFENRYEPLTETDGKFLKKWADEGLEVNDVINSEQRKKIFTIAKNNDQLIKEVIGDFGYIGTEDISVNDYKKICSQIVERIAS